MADRNLQIPRPWEVPYEVYCAILTDLKPTSALVKVAKHLTKRLDNGKKYGHVAAQLYVDWKETQGREVVVAWWRAYDEAVSALALKEEEEFVSPAPQTKVEDEGEAEFNSPVERAEETRSYVNLAQSELFTA